MEGTPADRATTKQNGNSPFLLPYPEAATIPTPLAKVFSEARSAASGGR
jgi:hypothetical protein